MSACSEKPSVTPQENVNVNVEYLEEGDQDGADRKLTRRTKFKQYALVALGVLMIVAGSGYGLMSPAMGPIRSTVTKVVFGSCNKGSESQEFCNKYAGSAAKCGEAKGKCVWKDSPLMFPTMKFANTKSIWFNKFDDYTHWVASLGSIGMAFGAFLVGPLSQCGIRNSHIYLMAALCAIIGYGGLALGMSSFFKELGPCYESLYSAGNDHSSFSKNPGNAAALCAKALDLDSTSGAMGRMLYWRLLSFVGGMSCGLSYLPVFKISARNWQFSAQGIVMGVLQAACMAGVTLWNYIGNDGFGISNMGTGTEFSGILWVYIAVYAGFLAVVSVICSQLMVDLKLDFVQDKGHRYNTELLVRSINGFRDYIKSPSFWLMMFVTTIFGGARSYSVHHLGQIAQKVGESSDRVSLHYAVLGGCAIPFRIIVSALAAKTTKYIAPIYWLLMIIGLLMGAEVLLSFYFKFIVEYFIYDITFGFLGSFYPVMALVLVAHYGKSAMGHIFGVMLLIGSFAEFPYTALQKSYVDSTDPLPGLMTMKRISAGLVASGIAALLAWNFLVAPKERKYLRARGDIDAGESKHEEDIAVVTVGGPTTFQV